VQQLPVSAPVALAVTMTLAVAVTVTVTVRKRNQIDRLRLHRILHWG